jgi:hypothetical protein
VFVLLPRALTGSAPLSRAFIGVIVLITCLIRVRSFITCLIGVRPASAGRGGADVSEPGPVDGQGGHMSMVQGQEELPWEWSH